MHNYPIFYFTPLSILGPLIKYWSAIYVWVYFWALKSVPLVYVSFMSVACCFDYCSFTVQLEIGNRDAYHFVLLSQGCFGYLGPFVLSAFLISSL